MKQLLVFLSILLLVAHDGGFSQEKYVDIIMFDVTRSMIGHGDGRGIDIFNDVKRVAKQVVSRQDSETYLVILPYGRRVLNTIFAQEVTSDADRAKASDFIEKLQASESETWLTVSFTDAIKELGAVKSQLPDFEERTQQILIFTDGKGNGPGDPGLIGFLKQHNLAQVDYPHLYTRFFAIGTVFSPEDSSKLVSAGVEIKGADRKSNFEMHTVTVRPSTVAVYTTKPVFELRFEYADIPPGTIVEAGITSQAAEQMGSAFDIEPKSFELTKARTFTIRPVNKENLEIQMRASGVVSIPGRLTLKASKILFSPKGGLDFVYGFAPDMITIDAEKKTIENDGSILLHAKSSSQEKVFFAVEMQQSEIGGVKYGVRPDRFEFTGEDKLRLNIEAADPDVLKGKRSTIAESVHGEMVVTFRPENPSTKITPSSLVIPIVISRDVFGPFIFPSFIVLLLFIVAAIVCYLRTARFARGASLERPDGERISLKGRICRRALFVGIGDKVDIRCLSLTGSGRLLAITPAGLNINVRKVSLSDQVKILDNNDLDSSSFLVNESEHFTIQDEGGTKETYGYYRS
jgi:hypothetical protein